MYSSNLSFKTIGLLFILLLQFNYSQAQLDSAKVVSNETKLLQNWIDDLYEAGVSMNGDSIYVSIDAQRLIIDQSFRSLVYPENYTWDKALDLIDKKEIKIAFWHFINLYLISDEYKNLVVTSILTYDQVLDMDKIMVSTFYSYCYMDPEIGSIENGVPEIVAPHILEKKLQAVKDIIYYLERYKEKEGESLNAKN